MARLSRADKTLTVKIVYYGPGLCGKTTNLVQLHSVYPSEVRGDVVKLDTETERTLFFDYFPAELGKVGTYALRAEFYTVPGQSFYNATRRAVLEGVDGIVFVADSLPSREDANLVSMANMRSNLQALGRDLDQVPLVLQWNKRDVPRALPVRLLQRQLNPRGLPAIEAVASQGKGVWETQEAVLKSVLDGLRQRARGRRRDARARR
jgi:signal recognition particle receptor subunit beta